jgi:hypothetical protein
LEAIAQLSGNNPIPPPPRLSPENCRQTASSSSSSSCSSSSLDRETSSRNAGRGDDDDFENVDAKMQLVRALSLRGSINSKNSEVGVHQQQQQ